MLQLLRLHLYLCTGTTLQRGNRSMASLWVTNFTRHNKNWTMDMEVKGNCISNLPLVYEVRLSVTRTDLLLYAGSIVTCMKRLPVVKGSPLTVFKWTIRYPADKWRPSGLMNILKEVKISYNKVITTSVFSGPKPEVIAVHCTFNCYNPHFSVMKLWTFQLSLPSYWVCFDQAPTSKLVLTTLLSFGAVEILRLWLRL